MSDILNRMSVSALIKKQDKETIPIDDIRHCPPGLRITDGTAKESFNSTWGKKKKERPKIPLKQVVTYKDGKEIFRGSVKETSKHLDHPVSTITTAIRRKTPTRTGYTFKEITDES